MIFFFLKREFLFKLILFVCSFYTRHFFFASLARTFNIDETDSIVFRRPISVFIPPTNTINQITTYMYLLNYYISNQSDHSLQYLFYNSIGQPISIAKAIYLKLSVENPQPYVSFFSPKFIASHKMLDPRNTHEKKFGPTKLQEKKILHPRNTYEKNFWTHEVFT